MGRKVIILALLVSLYACSETVEWKKEIYSPSNSDFEFNGQVVKGSNQDEGGCKIIADLIPQTLSGFRNTSAKGPYKLKVSTKDSACSEQKLLAYEVYADRGAKDLLASESPNAALEKHESLSLYFLMLDKIIDLPFKPDSSIYLKINFTDSANNLMEKVYKFDGKEEKGVTEIPLFTT